jgi:hypothetical protein
VPGLFEPVQLQARDVHGNAVPFLKSRWIDGVFAADLPARQLSRLYGTNHYVVSYINPFLLLGFRDRKTQGDALKPAIDLFKGVSRNALDSMDRILGKYVPASTLGMINKVAHDVHPHLHPHQPHPRKHPGAGRAPALSPQRSQISFFPRFFPAYTSTSACGALAISPSTSSA